MTLITLFAKFLLEDTGLFLYRNLSMLMRLKSHNVLASLVLHFFYSVRHIRRLVLLLGRQSLSFYFISNKNTQSYIWTSFSCLLGSKIFLFEMPHFSSYVHSTIQLFDFDDFYIKAIEFELRYLLNVSRSHWKSFFNLEYL